MREKKLGPVLLSGLIVGPILGSGIILLPPIIYGKTGDYAILAWFIMMIISFLFASLFGKLSVLFPNESGVAHTVELAFGQHIKQLTSVFFIIAGSVGPVAVLMTASQYLKALFKSNGWSLETYGIILMMICLFVLLSNISSVGKVSFMFSTVSTVVLLSGGISSIPFMRDKAFIKTPFHLDDFGYSILLLFWALVGWEIIGNYSLDVKNRKRTIPQAIVISSVVITTVCIVVAAAYQWIDLHHTHTLTIILIPLLGTSFASPTMAFITTILCMSTYLLVTGGVSRLIASENKKITLISYRSKTNIPIGAISILTLVHAIVFILLFINIINVEQIVGMANAFFISNAICGILSAYKLLPGKFSKSLSLMLIISFLIILSFSSIWILLMIALITTFYLIRHFIWIRQLKKSATNSQDKLRF
ncbi:MULTISPECIES: APC family permease [Bacillus]|uniref:APC family permease n=1 Tax=Bacillus TaxID=1386 RepID=UPI0001CE37AB|nr:MULTISPECIES: amino acid permease [Bacillus]HCJ7961250.1 amino acid permease [Klebsiella pneumoniae]AMK71150.1 amino acid permease [Bacillus subtilis subsp. natto]AOS66657.1 amino acid permease [Bacillus subtilis]API44810.1 amino acid permease [Bacillus subtilis]API96090.1 amino acid permease [Bacillus subtilis]